MSKTCTFGGPSTFCQPFSIKINPCPTFLNFPMEGEGGTKPIQVVHQKRKKGKNLKNTASKIFHIIYLPSIYLLNHLQNIQIGMDLGIVLESPVWSGYLVPQGSNRDRDRLGLVPRPKITGPDRK